MKEHEYKLLIHICQQCLRSPGLSEKQIKDIDGAINILFSEMYQAKENTKLCYGKKLKVGAKRTATKRTERKTQKKKTRTIIHGIN